jgi:hypothetical protein
MEKDRILWKKPARLLRTAVLLVRTVKRRTSCMRI